MPDFPIRDLSHFLETSYVNSVRLVSFWWYGRCEGNGHATVYTRDHHHAFFLLRRPSIPVRSGQRCVYH